MSQERTVLKGGDGAGRLQGLRVVGLVHPEAVHSALHLRTRKGKGERLTRAG